MKFKRTNNKLLAIILMLTAGIVTLTAQSSLLYFESQGIYGYRSDTEKNILYSFMAKDAMQKPSMGFDWLQRFSNAERDVAIASVQFRMSYNLAQKTPFEPQLYNAWLKYKAGFGDVSVGHLKPASGLSYTLDNHALLLPDMTMYNFTYDRDWGGLYSLDTSWGNLSASVTNASGMNLYNKNGNYMLAARASYGVLNEDNYTVGATIQKGVNLVAMGYHFHKLPGQTEPKLHPQTLAGIDGQLRINNLESAMDVYYGEFLGTEAYSLLWRNGINLFPEDKLKLEGQGIWRLFEGKHYVDYSTGFTFKLTPDLAFRAMYDWQDYTAGDDYYKVIGQIYYYKQLF
jgi:hypothetical protein